MKNKLKVNISNNARSKGFTLVEMIAVLAIIAILFSVFTPKVAGYIKEAKKTKALEEVRQVVLAIDTYNIKATNSIGTDKSFDSIKSIFNSYSDKDDLIDLATVKSIKNSMTYGKMKKILSGTEIFTLDDDGYIL